MDLNSSNSGCARLGSGVAPPLGVVKGEVAVLIALVRRHRHAVGAAVRRAVDNEVPGAVEDFNYNSASGLQAIAVSSLTRDISENRGSQKAPAPRRAVPNYYLPPRTKTAAAFPNRPTSSMSVGTTQLTPDQPGIGRIRTASALCSWKRWCSLREEVFVAGDSGDGLGWHEPGALGHVVHHLHRHHLRARAHTRKPRRCWWLVLGTAAKNKDRFIPRE